MSTVSNLTNSVVSGSQIDWNNPLTKNLISAFFFNERGGTSILDLVSWKTARYTGSAATKWRDKRFLLDDNNYFNVDSGLPQITGKYFSIVTRFKLISTTGQGAAVTIDTSTHRIGIRAQSTTSLRFGMWFNDLDVTVADMTTRVGTYVAVFRPDGTQEVWDDGVLKGSRNAGTTTAGTVSQYASGIYAGNTASYYEMDLILVYNRDLSANEVKLISVNPYQILKPSINRTAIADYGGGIQTVPDMSTWYIPIENPVPPKIEIVSV